jgi:DNA adenine methylase
MQTLKKPYKSCLRFPGGKTFIAEKLVAMFPKDISAYREPFAGGLSVFFAARSADVAETYWINDLFPHLYHFWKQLQKDRPMLQEVIQQYYDDCKCDPALISDLFKEARNTKKLTKFEAAVFLFILNRITFSGTILSGGFSPSASVDRFTQSSIDRLTGLEDALAGVRITNWDYHHLLAGTEDENVFLFLDPPYESAEKLYGPDGELHDFDHLALALELQQTQHRFMLTYCDIEEIRALYKWAKIKELELPYSMKRVEADSKRKPGSELIITNY